jgi:hypothetical protein
MALETFSYITSLNASNPVHATDQVSQGDDHLRGLKSTLLASFPNIDAAVNFTPTEANYLVGATGVTGTGSLVLNTAPTFSGLVTAGSFAGTLDAADMTTGVLPDSAVQETNVTQHEAAITILKAQISDSDYLSNNGTGTALGLNRLDVENVDTPITRAAAGQIAVDGDAIFSHESASYTSAKIHFSNGTEPTTEGANGDIFLVY